MKKRLTAIVLMLAFFTTTALAATAYKKSIEVEYGSTFAFNGYEQSLTDVNGNPVQPFIHNGTTYVPVRAVTGVYGSEIFYDADTKTISVYDDFSEICGVVYAMSNIVNSCFAVTLSETSAVASGTEIDHSAMINACNSAIRAVSDSLAYLNSDEGYNVNISIVTDEIMPNYQAFLSSFTVAQNAYNAYGKSPTSYTSDQFFDALSALGNNYDTALAAINTFFEDYCLWRDIGLN